MLHIVCDPHVAREGDYTERCQTGCSLGNRVFCFTGLSAFDEAGELQYLNRVITELFQVTLNKMFS